MCYCFAIIVWNFKEQNGAQNRSDMLQTIRSSSAILIHTDLRTHNKAQSNKLTEQ